MTKTPVLHLLTTSCKKLLGIELDLMVLKYGSAGYGFSLTFSLKLPSMGLVLTETG